MGKFVALGLGIAGVAITVITVAAGLCLLMAWPFMWLWNYSVVFAFPGVSVLDYWHAFGLMFFISLFCIGSRTSSSKSSD